MRFNPDRRLRNLERRMRTGDPQAWDLHYAEIIRIGQLEDYLEAISVNEVVEHVLLLGEALREHNVLLEIEGRGGPLMIPEPPPHRKFIALIGAEAMRQDGERLPYYVAPDGYDYGVVGHSELAMHSGVAGLPIERFLLIGHRGRVGVCAVQVPKSDSDEKEAFRGSVREILSFEVQREIRKHFTKDSKQILPLMAEHQPMLMYRVEVSDTDKMYRGVIELYHFLRSNSFYVGTTFDNYEQARLDPVINQVLVQQLGYHKV